METISATDRRVGLSAVFAVLGLFGTLVMLASAFGGSQLASGFGFAAAMVFATLLITALHLYD